MIVLHKTNVLGVVCELMIYQIMLKCVKTGTYKHRIGPGSITKSDPILTIILIFFFFFLIFSF